MNTSEITIKWYAEATPIRPKKNATRTRQLTKWKVLVAISSGWIGGALCWHTIYVFVPLPPIRSGAFQGFRVASLINRFIIYDIMILFFCFDDDFDIGRWQRRWRQQSTFDGCPQNLLQRSFQDHLGHPPILTKKHLKKYCLIQWL